jgi:hypothetical protein
MSAAHDPRRMLAILPSSNSPERQVRRRSGNPDRVMPTNHHRSELGEVREKSGPAPRLTPAAGTRSPCERFRIRELGLLAASLCLAFAAGEVLVRQLHLADRQPDFLMYSAPHYVLDDFGAVRHLPNKDVRAVRVREGRIVTDDRFHTNNLGLIDDRDYPIAGSQERTGERYAVAGNSFTVGMGGGEAWIPRLRDSLRVRSPDVEMYNLGVIGTGVEQFHDLLTSVSRQLTFTHIVIVVISHDFERGRWRPLTSDKEIRYCRMDRKIEVCLQMPPHATVIDDDASPEEILHHVRMRRPELEASRETNPVLRLMDSSGSRLLRLTKRKLRTIWREQIGYTQDRIEANLRALAAIRSKFADKPVILAHFPDVWEVQKGRYSRDLAARVAAVGVEYFPMLTECAWSPAMFHVRDPHPNRAGYDNAVRCLASRLSQRSDRAQSPADQRP